MDLNDLPLDRLSERAAKKKRGQKGPQETKFSNMIKMSNSQGQSQGIENSNQSPANNQRGNGY